MVHHRLKGPAVYSRDNLANEYPTQGSQAQSMAVHPIAGPTDDQGLLVKAAWNAICHVQKLEWIL